MTYVFKWDEVGWFIAVSVGGVLMAMLVEFDPATITDYRAWAVGMGAAAVRATAAAVLTVIARARRSS